MTQFADKRALLQALKEDAARMGITVPELIRRITSGAHIIGAAQPREMNDPPTYMASGEGNMPQIEGYGEPTDDFEEMAIAREQALVEAGGDDLAREVIYQKGIREKLQANNLISGNPSSAAKAAMGSIATVKSGVLGSNAPTVAYWTADSDAETRCVGVTLGMVPVSPTFGNFSVKPFGIVQWGTRGQLQSMEVDILTGCRFTVEGSQVILQVAQDVAVAPAADSQLILSGMLSFGSVSRPSPMTRTVDIVNANQAIPIKPFAKMFYIHRIPTSDQITVQIQNSGLQLLGEVPIAANAVFTDPIIIPNGATQINIIDVTGTFTRATVVFMLAF